MLAVGGTLAKSRFLRDDQECNYNSEIRILRCAQDDDGRVGMTEKEKGGAESVIGDDGAGLLGEVVVEESVAGFVASLDLEEQLGVAFVGEVGGAGKVHERAEMMDFARGGDGKPVVDVGVIGWAVAEVASEGDLEEAPVIFIREVRGVQRDLGVWEGGIVVVRW